MATCIEKYVEDKFTNPVSPKDGYVVLDCKYVKGRRVLEFLVLILYSEKPTRVTVTIGNTIFGALSGERKVDWTLVIWNTVKRLLLVVGKSKASSICPFVFHLYIIHDAIRPEDKKVYMVGESMLKLNVKLDEEDKSVGAYDSVWESLDATKIAKLQAE